MLSYLIILCLYSICRCLKLDLIDDYFVNVYVGDSKTKFKLLIDPTYPFTYLLKSYRTKTKKNSELKPSLFSNLYGNYSGKWSIDTFYFKEDNATIDMKYLDIYYKKKNILNVDGVLGLGSYIKHDASIYYNINQSLHNCYYKISTYDRKNKKIIICDNELSSKSNKFQIQFSYNAFNYPGLISITKLNLFLNESELLLNEEAYIGINPFIIISQEAEQKIENTYFENENHKKKKNNNIEIIHEKLYYNIFLDNKEYEYKYDENRDINLIKNYLDVYNFKNKIKETNNKWYFGFDQNNIERVEFNFDEGKINIFVFTYKYLVIRIGLFLLLLCFFIYAFIIVFQKRKDKSHRNENEQELMEI